jgi:hypothetical protein
MEINRQLEILEAVKELLSDETKIIHGVCEALNYLYTYSDVTQAELVFVGDLIASHKPTIDNELKTLTENEFWLGNFSKNLSHPYFGYWWYPMFRSPETRQIRIDYISKVIEKLK